MRQSTVKVGFVYPSRVHTFRSDNVLRKGTESFEIGISMITYPPGTILVGAGEDLRGAVMRKPKYLLYSAALVVFVWGINGVVKSQPDLSAFEGSQTPVVQLQNPLQSTMVSAATNTPSK